tara:strand:+ start:267 stop:689 length:423 start_codon:yes stop_codon:yes gene_type:complete
MIQIKKMMKIKKTKIRSYNNLTGKLTPFTFNNKFPIKAKRIFYIFGKKNKIRGEHAHRKCSQFLFPLLGNFELSILSKKQNKKFIMYSKKNFGFLIKPKTWLKIKFLSKSSVLMVVCDMNYNFKDYIEDLKEFKKIVGLK